MRVKIWSRNGRKESRSGGKSGSRMSYGWAIRMGSGKFKASNFGTIVIHSVLMLAF